MHQYPWLFLNILQNAWINCSEYARALNMHDHLICLTGFWRCLRFLNKPGFWIWHSCICKGYTEVRICLNMAPYAWICLNMPQCPSICLKMVVYCWMSLNMPEKARINCSDYARVLNMQRYSYNIIIIVTNVITLEFLSAWFIHPVTLPPFYLFLTWVRT